MPLDISKLENVKNYGSKNEAQCPACAELGNDKTGNHLFFLPSGHFGCVIHPNDKDHRRRIAELVGDESEGRNGTLIPPRQNRPSNATVSDRGDRWYDSPPAAKPGYELEISYPYHALDGVELYRSLRYRLVDAGAAGKADPKSKDFKQVKVKDGKFGRAMSGVDLVLYRLPEVSKAELVCVTEGEKDADSLRALGMCATTNVGGAGKWKDDYSFALKGKDVVVFPDNDAAGSAHADMVQASLVGVGVRSLRRVVIPPPHKDISDYLRGMSDTEANGAVNGLLLAAVCIDIARSASSVAVMIDHHQEAATVLPVAAYPSDSIIGDYLKFAQGHSESENSVILATLLHEARERRRW